MQILMTSSEKSRLGLDTRWGIVAHKLGICFKFCELENSKDLDSIAWRWRYEVQDEKKFFIACIKHGINYEKINI